MSWCSVLGCKEDKNFNRKEQKFPETDRVELRERWIKFCGQQSDWTPNKEAKICGAHFRDTDFQEDQEEIVKPGVIPSLKDSVTSIFVESSGNIEKVKAMMGITCRICRTENPEATISLFSHFKNQTVAEILNYCTSLEVDEDDLLPKILCKPCFIQLRAAKELKETCIISDKAFKRSLAGSSVLYVKEEDGIDASEFLNIKIEPIDMSLEESFDFIEPSIVDEPEILPKVERKKKTEHNGKRRTHNKRSKTSPHSKADDYLQCYDCEKKYDKSKIHRCKVSHRKCCICNIRYDNFKVFLQHFEDLHQKDRECSICNLKVNSARSLHYHIRTHQQKRETFMCEFCPKVFQYNFLLKYHRTTHMQEYQCDFCGFTHNIRATMVLHMTSKHLKSRNDPVPCQKCPAVFKRLTNWKLHQIHHHEAPAPVRCQTCGKGFLQVSQLNAHKKTAHQTIEESYTSYKHKCSSCNTIFKQPGALLKHMKRHESAHTFTKNGLAVLKYECTYCPKKFYRKATFEDHVRCHTGERLFQCTKCSMCFAISKTLRVHLKKIHKEKNPFVSTRPNIEPGNKLKMPEPPN